MPGCHAVPFHSAELLLVFRSRCTRQSKVSVQERGIPQASQIETIILTGATRDPPGRFCNSIVDTMDQEAIKITWR
jgi:hypothetical protein